MSLITKFLFGLAAKNTIRLICGRFALSATRGNRGLKPAPKKQVSETFFRCGATFLPRDPRILKDQKVSDAKMTMGRPFPLLTIVHDERGRCCGAKIDGTDLPVRNGSMKIRVDETGMSFVEVILVVGGVVSEMADLNGKDGKNAR
jgi:hypothetical protein